MTYEQTVMKLEDIFSNALPDLPRRQRYSLITPIMQLMMEYAEEREEIIHKLHTKTLRGAA